MKSGLEKHPWSVALILPCELGLLHWPHTFLSMWFDPLLSFMTIITNGDYKLKNISYVKTTMQSLPFWFWAKRQIFPFARASENKEQMISCVQSNQKNIKSLTKKFVEIVEKVHEVFGKIVQEIVGDTYAQEIQITWEYPLQQMRPRQDRYKLCRIRD